MRLVFVRQKPGKWDDTGIENVVVGLVYYSLNFFWRG